jgi:hypothetical protein
MQRLITGAGETGIALVDLDVGIPFSEVDEMVFTRELPAPRLRS